ncbi:MAG: metallophosphoesterase family protein [Candidatus Omnitrophota bacterium]|nr:metallophosphoesterase family protein [Candidatus Omnitrophota bacterium]
MKIGVLADTHIPERAEGIPIKVLDDFKNADLILVAGDLTTVTVLDKLKKIAPVTAVFGNMDLQDVVKVLKRKEVVKCGKFKIGIFHGSVAPDKLVDQLKAEFQEDKVDIIVFGHSHHPMNEYVGKILFFNPGSPTDKVFAPYNSYGILEINDKIKAEIKRL